MRPFRQLVEQCVDRGVTERPPVHGVRYAAFVVHPREPGPIVLAIGHLEGAKFVIDLLRDGLTVQQAVDLVSAYGLNAVTGADDEGDSSVSHAHAVLGVLNVLKEGRIDGRP
jgi:hypothetical protein